MNNEMLIQADSPESVDLVALRSNLKKYSFASIRGLIPPDQVCESLRLLKEKFNPQNDSPTRGSSAAAVRSNFQKLSIGGESTTASHDDARLFRAFYNPIWEPDIYGLRSAFICLAKMRNLLAGLPVDFATTRIEDNGLWTAARIHQYPAGGGFFRRHTDYVVKDIADTKEIDFYQLVLVMTRKGEDFNHGGAFVDIDGERICLDDGALPGDILIYDGRTVHGVEDIDPSEPLTMNEFNGRVAGFATLYKKM